MTAIKMLIKTNDNVVTVSGVTIYHTRHSCCIFTQTMKARSFPMCEMIFVARHHHISCRSRYRIAVRIVYGIMINCTILTPPYIMICTMVNMLWNDYPCVWDNVIIDISYYTFRWKYMRRCAIVRFIFHVCLMWGYSWTHVSKAFVMAKPVNLQLHDMLFKRWQTDHTLQSNPPFDKSLAKMP